MSPENSMMFSEPPLRAIVCQERRHQKLCYFVGRISTILIDLSFCRSRIIEALPGACAGYADQKRGSLIPNDARAAAVAGHHDL